MSTSHNRWQAANGPGPWPCSGCGEDVARIGSELESVTPLQLQGIIHHHDLNRRNNDQGNLRVMHHGCHVAHHRELRRGPAVKVTVLRTVPLYDKEQIADQLRQAIASGEITHKLPSVQDIARQANVAPGTARRALNILKAEGLTVGRPGIGTFIRRTG